MKIYFKNNERINLLKQLKKGLKTLKNDGKILRSVLFNI